MSMSAPWSGTLDRVRAGLVGRWRGRVAMLAVLTLLGGAAGCFDDGSGGSPDGKASPSARSSPSQRLGLTTGWGPTRAELDRAARQVHRLALPALAGQVIVARWPGGTAAPIGLVRRLHLGGVVAFSENVASTGALRSAVRALERGVDRPWPVAVGVDQEGGLVQRIRGDATDYPTFMAAGAARRPKLTQAAYRASGAELRGLGVNLVLAPDADVTVGPTDPVIGSRSAGSDPEAVARQSVAAAEGFLAAGVLPVVKHFPGHGSVTTDSHLGLPRQTASVAQLMRRDLVPFRAAAKAGLPAVMVGHIALQAVQPGVPATVSRPAITGILRERLGFDGLVMSDSLEMAALAGTRRPAVGFLRAGGDVVLMPPDPAATRDTIVAAVKRGQLSRARLEQAAARQVALLEHESGRGEPAPPGSARAVVQRLATSAVTVVAGACRGRLVQGKVVPMGDASAVAGFRAAAAREGLALGSVRQVKPPRPQRTGHEKRDRIRLQRWRRAPARTVVDGTPLHLDVAGVTPPSTGIAVSVDTPYGLGRTAAPVRLAAYGTDPASMDAVVRVLLGRAKALGHLPVPVPGAPRQGC
ncbi:glycoside hydrolase family 3 protein [Nocardioides acrostichi]|uniref:beta-N-acetylhexosaminidase n=1 Tax=Nocardioides acrostichi TaxID=2784339 RepID=A0A930UZ69_9ACTN|nr:glycoside hydrolase family 3 protein [Nocardioides acrostichi]MBF4160951.1 glycoside hydrolase family 3 protein [Nocardioides acrostichi]